MISPPARNFLNSTFVNVTSLRNIEIEPVLEIHRDDAAPRGITPSIVSRNGPKNHTISAQVPAPKAVSTQREVSNCMKFFMV